MKRNTVLRSTLAISVLGVLLLAGGCKSMGGKDEAVKCPSCGKTTSTFHPKKGRVYKKVACPSCKTVTMVDPATGIATATHACDACGVLVGKCPKCLNK